MTDLTESLLRGFDAAFGGAPAALFRAPGRVNLIGEHTDYNDGFVLPCAIGVETQVAIRPREDGRIRAVAIDFGHEQDAFAIGNAIAHHPSGGWRDYVRGTVAALVARGHAVGGADLAIAGSVPVGAGLSSSAALEVAIGRALLPALDATELARAAQAAENDFVGHRSGIMDQLVSAAGVAGSALLIDCRSLACRPVAIPAGTAILIVHSGVVHGHAEGEYNSRRDQCEEAAHALGVAALRDATPEILAAASLSDTVARRARHVVTENARTLAAADALARGDLVTMGMLMRDSHASMRDDFAITVPAIDRLQALIDGAIGGEGGARMTGGGFGGAVVALLREEQLDMVTAAVRRDYRDPAGNEPLILIETARAGAGTL